MAKRKPKPKQARLPIGEVFPDVIIVSEDDGVRYRCVAVSNVDEIPPGSKAALYKRVSTGRVEPTGSQYVPDEWAKRRRN